jgi:hypothetical protein
MKYFNIKNTILLIAVILIALISSSCTSSDDAATTTAATTTSDDTTTTGTTTDTQSSVSTPDNFATILSETISPVVTPTLKTSIADLDRVLLKYSSSYIHLDNSSYAVGIDSSISTYNDVFLKTFHLVPQSSESCWRLDSEKHSNWSLDYNSTTMRLELNDTFGYTRDANSSYLCFTFPSMNKMYATKRYTFSTSSSSYSEDTSFSAKYVEYDTTNEYPKLSSSSSAITVYDSGLDFAIPTGMNPSSATMVTNSRVAWTSSSATAYADHNYNSDNDKLYKDTHASYQDQVKTAGDDADTATAAATMLTAIKTDLEAAGSSLRYTKAVYTAFRNALLKTTLTGETIVGGSVGQNTAPYVFFTNEKDDSGTLHPFMVIASYSVQDRPNRLLDVTVPPGDGSGSYGESSVTRDALLGSFLAKIPLKDYGEVTKIGDNVMTTDSSGDGQNLADDAGDTNYNVYSWASINTVGMAVDGVEIYPLFNNVMMASVEKGEVTQSGIHVGQGMGLHWHGDGHAANGNKMNIYNLRDYVGYDHPPLIGFGVDGVALYGKYESSYSTMDGYSTAIDGFGGHEHDGYNYHYHAHTMDSSVLNALSGYGGSLSYTVAVLMKGAWAGLINDIPLFWNGDKPNGGSGNKYGGHKDFATYTP